MAKKSEKKIPGSLPAPSWLLLVHQLPSRPAYLRVKIWRRLRDIGAVALKNSIYALPRMERTGKDFQRLLREIEQGGGEGVLCEAGFVAGLRNDQAQNLFNSARAADYHALAAGLRAIMQANKRKRIRDAELKLKLEKARQRLAEIGGIDFFGASGRDAVEGLLSQLEHSLITKTESGSNEPPIRDTASLMGKLWVTRQGVHVDRIACAWLIRRFIDPRAKFKFVSDKKYKGAPGEFRFDMANAEFTHEGDKCSFEVLLERLGGADAALVAIAEIVHDLDLGDRKFGRPETPGIGHVLEGICVTQRDDTDRIARGSAILDDTYELFRRDNRR